MKFDRSVLKITVPTTRHLTQVRLICNTIYLMGIFGGSFLNLGTPTLSLQNIFLFPSLLLNIHALAGLKKQETFLYPILFLGIYVAIISLLTCLTPASEGFKALSYQYQLLNIFIMPLAAGDVLKRRVIKIAKVFLCFWFVWAILQLGVIVGLFPYIPFLFMRRSSVVSEENLIQINGPFGNANDLGCITLLTLLIILYYSNWKLGRNKYFYIAAVLIIMAMSRTALVLLLLLIPALLWIRGRGYKAIKLLLITFLIFFSLIVSRSVWFYKINNYLYDTYGYNAITVNFSRITSILNLGEKNAPKDGSASYRVDSYKFAIKNLPTHFTGTGYQQYKEFYEPGNFTNHLVWLNPHSFLIEIGIAYGFPALFCFLIFLCSLLVSVLKAEVTIGYKRFAIVTLIYTLILSNVPSSIIMFPALWIPLSFISGSPMR